MNAHHRAGGQAASQVCQCHLTGMHWVRVGCFVKKVGLLPLCSLGARALTYVALHRSKQKCKVCEANGAHVGDAGQQLGSCTWNGLEWR